MYAGKSIEISGSYILTGPREGMGSSGMARAAVAWDGGIRAATLPRETSIFSAELCAVTVIR